MTSSAEQASTAHRAHRAALEAARHFTDRNLSPEAIQKKRAEMEQAENDKYTNQRNAIQADAERSHTIRSEAAGEARPKITDRSHVAARWSQIKPLLDSGRTVRQVLAKWSGS